LSRPLQIILLAALGIALLAGGFSGGFFVGHMLPATARSAAGLSPVLQAATPAAETSTATPADLQDLFKPFWEAWQLVRTQYVDQPVDETLLMQGALRGMMEALGDRQSSYMDPRSFRDANASLEGSYEGIGAIVDTSGPYLTVISTFASGPAQEAGLLSGDQIIGLDREDLTGMDPEVVRQRVLGPAGTNVHLTIARTGTSAPLEFDITRAKITTDTAVGRMLEDGIAYVQIPTFGERTTRELVSSLRTLMAQEPRGLILDLRNNGGGLATQVPMVVLINEGSASSSEITAGALQDNGRAIVVGVDSFGKGSVQNWVPLSNDQGAVRITIARWLTPKDRQIEGTGLTPDVYVEVSAEDRQAQRDPQLEVALEVLRSIISGRPIPTSVPTATSTPVP
jgi:carboxyl-terminal processing protease